MELDPTHIDQEDLITESSRTLLLISAIRERDYAKKMLQRLWPMVEELRESLLPLEAEFNKWATKHYSAERRLAETRKLLLKPYSGGERRKAERHSSEMSDEDAHKFIKSQSRSDRLRLIEDLKRTMEKGD